MTFNLAALQHANVVLPGEVLIGERVARLAHEPADSPATVALVLALAAARHGSSALDLRLVPTMPTGAPDEDASPLGDVLAVPDAETWHQDISRSALVTQGVLHIEKDLVFLDRYWRDEQLIADAIRRRTALTPPPLREPTDTAHLDKLDSEQRQAVRGVFTHTTTVLTGGPGMGKTHTVARVITALRQNNPDLRIALAAPTGKAAARMSAALQESGAPITEEATTLHRLLGSRPDNSSRFIHNRSNALPHDVVIVDEASMISLSLMARLMESLRDTTRLLLIGDPDQLASVDAGSVLGDLISGLEISGAGTFAHSERDGIVSVIRLAVDHRVQGAHVDLARSLRDGDADKVMETFRSLSPGITFIESDDPHLSDVNDAVEHAKRLHVAAVRGDADAALAEINASRILTGHRSGPMGTRRWNRLVENALAEYAPTIAHHEMYAGRPLLITKNDYSLGLANGDTGVIINRDDDLIAVIETSSGRLELSPWRLGDIETMYAMTVHKAQGSQAKNVTVLVPPEDSQLLTRELLYTAVTRSTQNLTIIGTEKAVRDAVNSSGARTSGLSARISS